MKNIYLFTILLGLTIVGCNPMEDLHNEAKANDPGVVEEIQYTLTDDDYDDLDLNFGSFSSEEDAKTMLPDFLSDAYPYLSDGSSAVVGYNLYIGRAEGVSDYSNADIYQLTNDDYASTGSDAFGFYPNVDSDDHIPGVLDAAIVGATDGDIILAKYDQYFNDPEVGLANVYAASFPANYGDFENIDVLGDQGWSSDTGFALGSGYSGGAFPNEDWFISPEIDLTGMTNLKFQINQEIDLFGGDPSAIDILVSTDYTTGTDPMAAAWTVLDFDKTMFGNMTLSEDLDFAFGGATVHVAFKYTSNDTFSIRWRVESFAIKALGVDGAANHKGTHYAFDGDEWEMVDGVYFLSSADFDSMGEGSGQPGRYNNFGSSTPPDDYLPTFLASTSPWSYGQEEDEMIMVYDYYSNSSGAQIRGNRYTVINRVWVGHESTIETTLQFGLDNSIWVPDNTIRYAFITDDYTYAGETLEFESGFEDAAGNLLNYGNFNRQGGTTGWSDDMMITAIGIVLDNNDPSAADGQKYIVSVNIYNSGSGVESFNLIKTGGAWVAN